MTEQKPQEEELDLVELNPEDNLKTTDTGALVQEGEEDFDPNEYGGFPMEAWQKYLGAINDKQQARTATLSKYSTYNVRINNAPPDSLYPTFKVIQIQYYPLTKKAWEQRRMENSEVEDLQRQLQALIQRLGEHQESLRLRIFSRNKPRTMITNRQDPTSAQLEEIQNNMKFYEEFSNDIGRRVSQKRQESDLAAFQMYFHKGKEVYEQIMNEDLDDILRACDFKQIYGSANLRLSKPLPSLVASPGTS
jgi:hypothetical protein